MIQEMNGYDTSNGDLDVILQSADFEVHDHK